jgi:deoxyribonuclease-4
MRSMLPDGRRLGAHLPLATGMLKAVERARDIGANAMQIFTDNPTAWKRRAEPPPELDAFRERTRELDIRPISVHASYLVNLAGSNPESYERSIVMLAHELRQASTFGARYVNVHIGSHLGLGVAAGIERLGQGILRTIAAADEDVGATAEPAATADVGAEAGPPAEAVATTGPATPAMLVLENSAGSGGGLGTTVDELASIAERIAALGIPEDRVGFCIDTAHAWGAGIDLANPSAIDAFVAAFDDRIGLGRLVLIHLNDSRSDRGSRTDRHEHLGAGQIGPEGLAHVLRHPRLARVTYLLETPGMDVGYDAINLARARDLAAGTPLGPLPPEAFELRGSSTTRTAPA